MVVLYFAGSWYEDAKLFSEEYNMRTKAICKEVFSALCHFAAVDGKIPQCTHCPVPIVLTHQPQDVILLLELILHNFSLRIF